jgi:Domain of unknown function (DU1801)
MALKTRPTDASVNAFLAAIPDESRREDCVTVARLMREATGAEPRMWGTSIVGFGSHRYRYESGREGDWFVIGFAPRKQDLTLYLTYGFDRHPALMKKLGRHKAGRACLHIRRLSDVDLEVLKKLIAVSVAHARPASA